MSAPLAGIPASRYQDQSLPGWPGWHVIMVIAHFIFVAFNKSAEISANRASPAHVIRALFCRNFSNLPKTLYLIGVYKCQTSCHILLKGLGSREFCCFRSVGGFTYTRMLLQNLEKAVKGFHQRELAIISSFLVISEARQGK